MRERPDDIALLFRKFAADFAEKYRMPAIQLTDDARHMLVSYSWPGNIRQLKNITEQISIIETNRDITADILQGVFACATGISSAGFIGSEEYFRRKRF